MYTDRKNVSQFVNTVTILNHMGQSLVLYQEFQDTGGCLVECLGSVCRYSFVVFWIPFGVLQSIVLVLTAGKSFQSCRHFNL